MFGTHALLLSDCPLKVQSLIVWFVLFPQTCLYVVFGALLIVLFTIFFSYSLYYTALFATNFYIILTSQYIQVRQKDLLAKFVQINTRLVKQSQSSSKVSLLREYFRLNVELTTLASFIQHYTHLCAYILSSTLPGLITTQCYLMHVVLFDRNVPFYFYILYTLATVELNAVLFGIIRHCSMVAKNNSALEGENYRFYLNYLIKQPNKINTRSLLKVTAVRLSIISL